MFNRISKLLDIGAYEEAREIVQEAIHNIPSEPNQEEFIFQTKLYGFLIDIGCESKNEIDLEKSIEFYETNESRITLSISKSSYYYNIGNAKHGLGNIFYFHNRGIHFIDTIKGKFQEPIKLYWLAYKNLDNKSDELAARILINLSNSLIVVGRIVEALQFLDMVLKKKPNYPQALISRGDSLQHLTMVTNCAVTTALYVQIYESYNRAIQTNLLPPHILQRSEIYLRDILATINSHGFDITDINKELKITQEEYGNHTPLRKFSIDHHLTLNEHSLYCNCVASEKDDLQIGVKHGTFKDNVLPKLELLLNRIKSEFAFARYLYYQSLQTENVIDYDAKFSELLDGEIINAPTEMLRTSYRICYGILDKIALGICKLYNLDRRQVYFESFWEKPRRKPEIDQIKNLHLNALYSIACDLNTDIGELKQFKDWRNKLEHNLLVLKDTNIYSPDVLNIFDDSEFISIIDIDEFKSKTLHLLQLTRAAIFSYVFCIRLETIQTEENEPIHNSFVIDFKK